MAKDPLGKWISILYRYSMIYANDVLKNYGMSGGQLPFFMNIVNNPGITQEELSKRLRIDKSTTARAVKSLFVGGFVEKRIYEKDKRINKLYPTERALRVKEEVLKAAKKWDEILLKGFPGRKKEDIRSALEEMVKNALVYLEQKEKG